MQMYTGCSFKVKMTGELTYQLVNKVQSNGLEDVFALIWHSENRNNYI